MARKVVDLSGLAFGALTVMYKHETKTTGRKAHWVCNCDCGKVAVVRSDKLRRGETRSCGCGRFTPRGGCPDGHEFTNAWKGMLRRSKMRGGRVGFASFNDAYRYLKSLGWVKGLCVCRGTKENPDQGDYTYGNVYIDTTANNLKDYYLSRIQD